MRSIRPWRARGESMRVYLSANWIPIDRLVSKEGPQRLGGRGLHRAAVHRRRSFNALTEVPAMSTVVDLRKTDDPRDAVHRAVHLLAEGHIVAFPTETVYAACVHSLMTAAVQKLSALAGRGEPRPIRPLFSRDFRRRSIMSLDMDRLGQRLARRCWPGPVTLAFAHGLRNGPLRSAAARDAYRLGAG